MSDMDLSFVLLADSAYMKTQLDIIITQISKTYNLIFDIAQQNSSLFTASNLGVSRLAIAAIIKYLNILARFTIFIVFLHLDFL